MQQGIYTINDGEYHRDPAPEPSLSSSLARTIITQSPLHAWHKHPRLNSAHESEESSRFDLGSAAHAVLLENDFNKIVFVEADDWRTKEAKLQRDMARAKGLLPILSKYETPLREMVHTAKCKIERSELAGLFENGKPEQTLIWQEGEAWCRARLDYLRNDNRVILDYKTTESAEPEVCKRKIAAMGYDMQASFYKRGLVACGGSEDAVFIFLFQEIEPPYACCLIGLSEIFIEIADENVNQAINIWQMCIKNNVWPGYSGGVQLAEPPNWQLQQYLNMMEERALGENDE